MNIPQPTPKKKPPKNQRVLHRVLQAGRFREQEDHRSAHGVQGECPGAAAGEPGKFDPNVDDQLFHGKVGTRPTPEPIVCKYITE